MSNPLQRNVPFILSDDRRGQTVELLQGWLPSVISLALRLKQAHWNLRGERFKSVHEQLDEILVDVRTAVDDVAERIVTVGGAADGLPETVAEAGGFEPFPKGLLTVETAIESIAKDLVACANHGRERIAGLGEVDPISEDLVIQVVGSFEKHYWMLTSQRDGN